MPIIDLFLKCIDKKQYCYYSCFRTNPIALLLLLKFQMKELGEANPRAELSWGLTRLLPNLFHLKNKRVYTANTYRIHRFLLDIGIVNVELSKISK